MSITAEELKSPFEDTDVEVTIKQRTYEEISELHAKGDMAKYQNYGRNKKQVRIGREIAGDLKDAREKYRDRRYATGENWR